MKIVIWHYDRYPTAPGVYLGHFPRLGHELTWVTSVAGERAGVVERHEGGARHVVIVRRRDSALPRPWSILVNRWHKAEGLLTKIAVMRRLAAERPDVLQVRETVVEGLLALFFARRMDLKFSFQFDYPHAEAGLYNLDQEGRRAPGRRLYLHGWRGLRNFLLRRADLVLPISDALAERVHRRLGVPRERMIVFPVGVSEAVAAVVPPARETGRSPTVGYLGNLSATREPARIFEVLRALHRRIPEARLSLVGATNPLVDRLIADYEHRDRIDVLGLVPYERVPEALRRIDVGLFVVPAVDPRGIFLTLSPLKVVEYLSCGVPVVASRVPDAEGVLAESGGGQCVEAEPGAFAAALADYLLDPDKARAAGERGRQYVLRHRSFAALAEHIEPAYRRLIAGANARDDGPASRPGESSPRVGGRRPLLLNSSR